MNSKRLEIFGVTEFESNGEKKNSWTKVGAAFRNQDGSFNLVFDYLPADLRATTLQVREPKEKKTAAH